MNIDASGVQGLMAKELTSQRLAELLQAVGQIPGGADYINMPELMKEVFRSLEVVNDCVILSEEEVQQKRQQAEANEKSEGSAEEQMLHADSTRGQLITHIRPSLKSPVPYGPVA